MRYDPYIHQRKSIRLKEYDYSQPGVYFITNCIYNHECLLGEIIDNQIKLNKIGIIIDYQWRIIPKYFRHVELDYYTIMPNHMHGIIIIKEIKPGKVGAKHFHNENIKPQSSLSKTKNINNGNGHDENASPLHVHIRVKGTTSGSLSAIMQNYSSVTTRKINRIRKTPGARIWQRNFYERIIRDEIELNRIRKYIAENPLKWDDDEYNAKKGEGEAFS
jgi:putative transposase